MNLTHESILLPRYADVIGENYSNAVKKAIHIDAIAWLNSLPMTEYAHTLLLVTSHHFGGEPTQYIRILYNKMLSPILGRYYRELELYRFKRNIEIRRYDSLMHLAHPEGHVIARSKFAFCTAKVRATMRYLCQYFDNLRGLPEDDPKITQVLRFVDRIVTSEQMDVWEQKTEEFVTANAH